MVIVQYILDWKYRLDFRGILQKLFRWMTRRNQIREILFTIEFFRASMAPNWRDALIVTFGNANKSGNGCLDAARAEGIVFVLYGIFYVKIMSTLK
jgi:hypothetical protein